jgi:hypothetical protein
MLHTTLSAGLEAGHQNEAYEQCKNSLHVRFI